MFFGPQSGIPSMAKEAFGKPGPTANPGERKAMFAKQKGAPDHAKAQKHLFHALAALQGRSAPDPGPVPGGGPTP